MEDIFARSSLCYLTNRCDEGFELIYSFLIFLNEELNLHQEEEETFCLISRNILEKRYQSWINLHQLLRQTDQRKTRQSIEIYIEIISNELHFYSKKILFLIEKYLLKFCQTNIFYLKMQGDIHLILSQISKPEEKFEQMQLALHFYDQSLEICSFNQIFSSIIINKSFIFLLIDGESNRAKEIIKEALDYFKKKKISHQNLLENLKYFEDF